MKLNHICNIHNSMLSLNTEWICKQEIEYNIKYEH